jgi:excisionase family DNA binding protein
MKAHDADPTPRGSAPQQAAILSRQQAAAFLGVSDRTFDRMQREEAIPYVTVGKRKKYLLRDLEAYLQSQRSV